MVNDSVLLERGSCCILKLQEEDLSDLQMMLRLH